MSTSTYRTEFTMNDVNNTSWSTVENTLLQKIIDKLPGIDRATLTKSSTDVTATTVLTLDSAVPGKMFGFIEVITHDTSVANDYSYSRYYFKFGGPASGCLGSLDVDLPSTGLGSRHTIALSVFGALTLNCTNVGGGDRIISYGFCYFDISL